MRKLPPRSLVALVAAAALAFSTFAAAGAGSRGPDGPTGPHTPESDHAADRVLVKFKAGTSASEQEEVHRRHGGTVIEGITGIGVQVVSVPRPKDRPQDTSHEGRKAHEYGQEASVEFAEPDGGVQAQALVPNDPLLPQQWSLTKIDAYDAWAISTGTGVKVAVLDTGVDQDHEDVGVILNKNFTTSKTVDDKYGHGTHVSGTIAAHTNNGKGVAGVAPDARLMNVKVLRDDGWGWWSWVAKGITYSTDNGAKVISMSLGGETGSSTLQAAVDYAWNKGVVVVAAAGNQSSNIVLYPAAYPAAIAVAATNADDQKSDFSNYGPGIDIAAPGGQWGTNYAWLDPAVGILSTTPNQPFYYYYTYGVPLNYGSLAGTSMATPHVSGVAALVIAKCPAWSNAQVRQRIESSTDPINDLLLPGIGRLNAYKAVQAPC